MTYQTTRELSLNIWGSDITLPKGTKLRLVKNGNGLTGDAFAVDSIELLTKLTGNTHDPKYRYCFVPDDAVTDLPNWPGRAN